nr:MAG TPA: hypothetical protein [Crassvirales sp.]
MSLSILQTPHLLNLRIKIAKTLFSVFVIFILVYSNLKKLCGISS